MSDLNLNLNLKKQLKYLNNYLNNSNSSFSSDYESSASAAVYDYYYYYEPIAVSTPIPQQQQQHNYIKIKSPTPISITTPSSHNQTETIFNDNNNKLKKKKYLKENFTKNLLNKTFKNENSIFENLLKLNIKRENIEKALAATAYKSQIDAINWLLEHSNDKLLNNNLSINSTRDFILLLCPINTLSNEIEKFLNMSKIKCGPNDAHYNNKLPFMKLTPFFQVDDSDIINLHRIFDFVFKYKNFNNLKLSSSSIISKSLSSSSNSSSESSNDSSDEFNDDNNNNYNNNQLNEINIDLHVSSQMILLYPDIDSENLIKNLVIEFSKFVGLLQSKSLKNYQQIVPYSKQLHLTLAYQFENEHKKILEDLAYKYINYYNSSEWAVRLYSRDSRLEGRQTFKVNKEFKSKSDNSVYCKIGEFIYADKLNNKDISIMNGTTHSGGENVTFAAKNVDRVPESDTWQLHRDHVLVQNSSLNNSTEKVKTENDSKKRNSTTPGELKFAILRHGERVDLVFGPQWLDTSFDHHGNYRRNNLNLPHQLPQRSSKRDYNGDSPITEIGKVQAKFTGDALKTESFNFQYCYVSPSLRSIQTAHHVLEAMGLEKVCKIRIEPSLFEFLGWYEKGAPNFLNIESLISFGYNIDNNYKPLITADMLQADENYTDYYIRSYNLVKHMTNLHQRDGGHVLVVGHAATLEVCTRQITGQQIRTYADFNATIRKVPYLGCCVLQKTNETGFDIVPSNIPPLTHGATFNFDPMTLKI